jgi:hypothetical protein
MADYRTAQDRRLAPPPALPGPDALEQTARQVRIDGLGAVVHRLRAAVAVSSGRWYETACGESLTAFEGAILTTQDASCHYCLTGEKRPNR